MIALHRKVYRLQGIVKRLAKRLKDAGHPQEAALVLKELGRSYEEE